LKAQGVGFDPVGFVGRFLGLVSLFAFSPSTVFPGKIQIAQSLDSSQFLFLDALCSSPGTTSHSSDPGLGTRNGL
jgi:hypothetical protein